MSKSGVLAAVKDLAEYKPTSPGAADTTKPLSAAGAIKTPDASKTVAKAATIPLPEKGSVPIDTSSHGGAAASSTGAASTGPTVDDCCFCWEQVCDRCYDPNNIMHCGPYYRQGCGPLYRDPCC